MAAIRSPQAHVTALESTAGLQRHLHYAAGVCLVQSDFACRPRG
jgi:hypothetical protein